jgi:hypothetical protein
MVTYDDYMKSLLKVSQYQRQLDRFCPFACRNGGVVCVGRGSERGKVLVITANEVIENFEPKRLDHLPDCPVIRWPNDDNIRF